MKHTWIITAITSVLLTVSCQSGEQTQSDKLDYCGSSRPYVYSPHRQTAAPRGYKPFYISHFSRHGSRYHGHVDRFDMPDSVFRAAGEAGQLTEQGLRAAELISAIREGAAGKSGRLSAVGQQEHHDIAMRMAKAYPQVFEGEVAVTGRATAIKRTGLSMQSFIQGLQECQPQIALDTTAGWHTHPRISTSSQPQIDFKEKGPWRETYRDWAAGHTSYVGLIGRMFKDESLFADEAQKEKLASAVIEMAITAPASGLERELLDMLGEDELHEYWIRQNAQHYMSQGPYAPAEGVTVAIGQPLLRDIMARAQDAVDGTAQIDGRRVCADLRFSHDAAIYPLLATMQIEGACASVSDPDQIEEVWQDYNISCMATNIQWIFYRNRKGNVLVKMLLNEQEARIPVETDCWPYYRWEDVRHFYTSGPIDIKMGDPHLLLASDDHYYLYGTTDGDNSFSAYRTYDFAKWDTLGVVYQGHREDSWTKDCFWAPEVYERDGRYYMFFSANTKYNPDNELEVFRIGVAVSDKPEGPFIDMYDGPVFDPGYPVIDANVFFDDDGRCYLYYSRCCYKHAVDSEIAQWARSQGLFEEIEESWVYGVELKPDFSGVIGEPQLLLCPPATMDDAQSEWESRSVTCGEANRRWTEGSHLIKKDGIYYIMYSANFFGGENYAIGYATGDSPLGPFTKSPDNPLLQKNTAEGGNITGVGHNSVTYSRDGEQMYCVYHGRTDATGSERVVFVSEMEIADGHIRIVAR